MTREAHKYQNKSNHTSSDRIVVHWRHGQQAHTTCVSPFPTCTTSFSRDSASQTSNPVGMPKTSHVWWRMGEVSVSRNAVVPDSALVVDVVPGGDERMTPRSADKEEPAITRS
ncbi:predicted protein [Plenodomus lingam JN3]|uniref:Predicted protein n=1 Tax=Leptosphaeria maculans (strain JN3 / isolate v23.1.3 / race Av1-4-5-6-7-8) TaxID=985895 RepID=E5AD97_LEPMJ|nr:predicted protein [Plenodomus lingam JN3]CBY02449.1 predicted protein [Plenodomus lingam JN3]